MKTLTPEEFEGLVAKHWRELHNHAKRLTDTADDAEDLRQNALVVMLAKIDEIEGPDHFVLRAKCCMNFKLHELWREKSRTRERTSGEGFDPPDTRRTESVPGEDVWQRASSCLTSEEFEVIHMRLCLKMSYKEIADTLSLDGEDPEAAARQRFSRAIGKLRNSWHDGSDGPEHPPKN